MKVKIKTAHGYLSFQPDGRLEYREKAGPWEEIDVEGLVLAPVAAPSNPAPPPSGPYPTMDVTYVEAVKAQLQQEGVDLSGPCGAFRITKRVAWGLRARGAGLLSKPGGNNCEGYATDVIVFLDGFGIDLLGDGGGANVPSFNRTEVDDLAARWRAPVQP